MRTYCQSVVFYFCALTLCLSMASVSVVKDKFQPRAAITVQATNNTAVPSVTYIVSAIECLEEAFSIYDTDEERASLYAALFAEKHNGSWNVVVGYTTVYVHSTIYIEAIVNAGKDKKDDPKGVYYLIFSSD